MSSTSMDGLEMSAPDVHPVPCQFASALQPLLRATGPAGKAVTQYEKMPGVARAPRMKKEDSAKILRAFEHNTVDVKVVFQRLQGQLSEFRTTSQIRSHSNYVVKQAHGDWDEALRRVESPHVRGRRFKRKIRFAPDEAFEIALSLRGFYYEINRHAQATQHTRAYLQNKPHHLHQIDLDDMGTGPHTLHEKVKNHILNNIDKRFNGDLEAAIAANAAIVHQQNLNSSDGPGRQSLTVSMNPIFGSHQHGEAFGGSSASSGSTMSLSMDVETISSSNDMSPYDGNLARLLRESISGPDAMSLRHEQVASWHEQISAPPSFLPIASPHPPASSITFSTAIYPDPLAYDFPSIDG